MYYNNNFRNGEPVEYEDEYNNSEFEQGELPPCCPYRQFTQATENYEDYYMRAPNMPSGPPPSFAPQEGGAGVKSFGAPGGQGGPATQFVEQGAIRPCLFRNIYIWPRRGNGFWAFLTFVGRRSVSGFRWQGRRWVYFGMDLRDIRSFQCF